MGRSEPWVAALVLVVLVLVLAMILAICVCRALGRPRALTKTGGAANNFAADDFPYWAKSLPPAAKMFAALRAAPVAVARTQRGPVLERAYPADYRRADAISNHFTERARLTCRAGGGKTPREAWEEMAERHRGGEPGAVREKVYGASRECNIFNPTFVKWVLGETAGAGAKVLDPSAGWGDRLIGALAAGAQCYHGYDPNPSLQSGYKKIVDDLGQGDHENFRVTEQPFEEADLPANSYDVAFTSPPYYAFEEYVEPGGEGEAAQSIGRYPDYETWVAKMYRPYLANAYRAVRPGGWVVLYIEDVRLGGERYRLGRLTEEIMEELGAGRATDFGLRVVAREPSAGGRRGRGGRRNPKSSGRRAGREKPPRWAMGWVKCAPPAPADLSPPLVLERHTLADGRRLEVVRDDRLYAGTKQRGLAEYVRRLGPEVKTVLYTGAHNGYGPAAAALAARVAGIKAHLVLDLHPAGSPRAVAAEVAQRARPVVIAKCLGAVVEFAQDWAELNARGKQIAADASTYWPPLGFLGDVAFAETLAAALRAAAANCDSPARVWVAGGSGTLARALHGAFPRARIMVVPVTTTDARLGKLRQALADVPGAEIWTGAAEKQAAPYPTVQGYDSRAWDAAVAAAESGDWVWNVGGAP